MIAALGGATTFAPTTTAGPLETEGIHHLMVATASSAPSSGGPPSRAGTAVQDHSSSGAAPPAAPAPTPERVVVTSTRSGGGAGAAGGAGPSSTTTTPHDPGAPHDEAATPPTTTGTTPTTTRHEHFPIPGPTTTASGPTSISPAAGTTASGTTTAPSSSLVSHVVSSSDGVRTIEQQRPLGPLEALEADVRRAFKLKEEEQLLAKQKVQTPMKSSTNVHHSIPKGPADWAERSLEAPTLVDRAMERQFPGDQFRRRRVSDIANLAYEWSVLAEKGRTTTLGERGSWRKGGKKQKLPELSTCKYR